MADGERVNIQPATVDDLDRILEINNAAIPHVNRLSRDALLDLVRRSVVFCKACHEAGIAGFLLALDQGAVYASENYQWFVKNVDRFVYVDRIAVSEECRGMGVGKALYRELFREALRLNHDQVTCEVNLVPPNPASLQFHRKLGFQELAQLRHVHDEKVVSLLAVKLDSTDRNATVDRLAGAARVSDCSVETCDTCAPYLVEPG